MRRNRKPRPEKELRDRLGRLIRHQMRANPYTDAISLILTEEILKMPAIKAAFDAQAELAQLKQQQVSV